MHLRARMLTRILVYTVWCVPYNTAKIDVSIIACTVNIYKSQENGKKVFRFYIMCFYFLWLNNLIKLFLFWTKI